MSDIPDLHYFDWILINTSSGKDSQTQMRYVVKRCVEANVDLGRLVAVHADLGTIEWPGCPDLAGLQAMQNSIWRFEVTKRTGCDLLEYARRRGKWPSPQQRWCTSDFKRGPIRRVMTKLTNEMREWEAQAYRREPHRVRILNCMGMRAQESPARAKLQPFELDGKQVLNKHGKLVWRGASNSLREVWNWLPIHEWPVEEVWSDIRKSGVPHHEVYDLGMPRLSCSLCIFAPESALMLAGKLRPDLLERYVQVERETGHTFKAKSSLLQIQQAIAAGESAAAVADWRI